MSADVIGAALVELRRGSPGVPLEVSTAAWIESDASVRLTHIQRWVELPDSAGVNFGESGAVELAQWLLSRGVGIEAGLFVVADAQRLVEAGLAGQCNHIQIEPIYAAAPNEALTIAQGIEHVLNAAGVTTPRLLHGKDVTAWPLLAYALSRGYATRIGLEDTLQLPDGRMARGNAELVQVARAVGESTIRAK